MADDEAPDTEELETEETVEEDESTSDDDSEDTGNEEESTDDSDETEDGEEESSETEQYLDLKSLPPQLREAGRRMLANHTKAMQRIPKLVQQKLSEAQDQLQVQYSAAIIKAKGFDDLVNHPNFQKFWDDIDNNRPYGYSADAKMNGKNDEAEGGKVASETLSADAIAKAIMPQVQKMINEAVGPIRKQEHLNAWKDAESRLPNFGKHRAAITAKLASHPTLSIDEAYDLVAKKDIVDKNVSDALAKATSTAKKIPGKSLKPGGVAGGSAISKATAKTIEEAIGLARKDMASKGK